MRVSYKRDTFRIRNVLESVGYVRYHFCTCLKCGTEGKIKDSTQVSMPASVIAKKFRQLGWWAPKPAGGECPTCVAGRRARSHYQKTKEEPGDHLSLVSSQPKEAVMAEAPRQPTIAERRRIYDEIETRWLQDKGCYQGNWSDASLAEAINLPRAWVSDTRNALFGDADKNESRDIMIAVMDELKAEHRVAEEHVTKAMAVVDAMGQRIKKIELQLSYGKAA